jgi:hypothetical protein
LLRSFLVEVLISLNAFPAQVAQQGSEDQDVLFKHLNMKTQNQRATKIWKEKKFLFVPIFLL